VSAAGPPASGIYEGWVHHRRQGPIEHGFRYRLYMPLFDLDELPEILDRHPLWSARRPAPVRFRRSDFLPGRPGSLSDAARSLVAERTGRRPDGPVLLLAQPRYLGVGFNPIAVYYLYGSGGALEAMIGEVTNTPWGERQEYVIAAEGSGPLRGRFAKRLHVSPFMPMEQTYEWSATAPGEALRLGIASEQEGRPVFAATLSLRRHPVTTSTLTRALVSYPPMTIATLARIYWNAMRLRLKGAPLHRHPEGGRA
jgi:DUF1365 family protein